MKTKLYHYQEKLPASLKFNLIAFKTQKRKEKNNKQIKELKSKLFIKATIDSNLISSTSPEKNYCAYSLPINHPYHR
ncbi:hypothetical protein [Candidatus Vesicomyidisocius sp. SY067_SCS001]|uniref:hypothetical protein n=1 Tax=Candidatus Vesicomyidisocius sp. SY067_SCS001 TaxID=2732590 RepID=UPI001684947B|nr:hypothetical protein [Candidatus Vesicomyosocius sp. SY067_SCS001]